MVISMKFVIKDTVNLMTRFLYKIIDSCNKWDTNVNITNYPNAYGEIIFWRDNVDELNSRDTIDKELPPKFEVHSDASNDALGVVVNIGMSCHRNLSEGERCKSSTWREVTAIFYGLEVFEECFAGTKVSWYTDNYAAAVIIKSGSGEAGSAFHCVEYFSYCQEVSD